MESPSDVEQLRTVLTEQNIDALRDTLAKIDGIARAIARFDPEEQVRLFQILPAAEAAEVAQQLPKELFREILEALPTSDAAAIVDQFASDEQVDLIDSLPDQQGTEVLTQMAPAEKADVDALRSYAPDTAGGMMIREYVTVSSELTVADVVRQLQSKAAEYSRYEAQYLYVVSADQRLLGVAPL